MKAIDFSCNLLKNVGESPLSPAGARVLFCIAAGLHHRQDIDSFLFPGGSNGSWNTLRHLISQDFIQEQRSNADAYYLTPAGKELITHLLRFLPHQH